MFGGLCQAACGDILSLAPGAAALPEGVSRGYFLSSGGWGAGEAPLSLQGKDCVGAPWRWFGVGGVQGAAGVGGRPRLFREPVLSPRGAATDGQRRQAPVGAAAITERKEFGS